MNKTKQILDPFCHTLIMITNRIMAAMVIIQNVTSAKYDGQ